MNVCFIYSGHRRTWDQCQHNHIEMLGEGTSVHYEDHNGIDFYIGDEFGYESNKVPETVVASTTNQWHNMFQAFVKAPKGYDVYVRMRYDTWFSEKVDFTQYDLSDNKIYIPSGNDYRDGVNDQMAFGNYNAIKRYYEVYLTHKMLFSHGKTFHTESYVKWNLEHFGIEIHRINCTNSIIRL